MEDNCVLAHVGVIDACEERRYASFARPPQRARAVTRRAFVRFLCQMQSSPRPVSDAKANQPPLSKGARDSAGDLPISPAPCLLCNKGKAQNSLTLQIPWRSGRKTRAETLPGSRRLPQPGRSDREVSMRLG